MTTLTTFLNGSTSSPDIVGITETSEQKDTTFISNVSMPGYKLYHTPTNLSKGGCCIYVNEGFDVFEREDLKTQNNNFQSNNNNIR